LKRFGMKKRVVESLKTVWWVWLGEAPAMRVESEDEALELLRKAGRDLPWANRHGRSDCACAVLEVVWDEASLADWQLEARQTPDRSIIASDIYFRCDGAVARVLAPLTPSRLAAFRRSWAKSAPLPPWGADRYDEALNDPATVVLRGRRLPLEERIRAHRKRD
jgi:hypothetical protein